MLTVTGRLGPGTLCPVRGSFRRTSR